MTDPALPPLNGPFGFAETLAMIEGMAGRPGSDVIDLFWISPQPIGLNDRLVSDLRLPEGWTAHHAMGHSSRVDLTMLPVSDEAVAAIGRGELLGVSWKPGHAVHCTAPRGLASSSRFRRIAVRRAEIRSGAFPPYNGTMLGIWGERAGRGLEPMMAIGEDTLGEGARGMVPALVGNLPMVMLMTGWDEGTVTSIAQASGEEALRWELGRKGLSVLLGGR